MLVFDVDGTLTETREKISAEMTKALEMVGFDNVGIITGSDTEKTKDQIGEIWDKVLVGQCSGNQIWNKGEKIFESNWEIPDDLRSYLKSIIRTSRFELRTGNHIEDRIGMCNFSVIGRGATKSERKKYIEWDKKTNERENIYYEIRDRFPEVGVSIAGDTGIDIYQRGKEQFLDWIPKDKEVIFFGDRTDKTGNDFLIARRIDIEGIGKVHVVNSVKETLEILQKVYLNDDNRK